MANDYHSARISKIFHMGIPGEIIKGTARWDDPKSGNVAINIKADEQHIPGKQEFVSPNMKHEGMSFNRVEADGPDGLHADRMASDKAIAMMPTLGEDKPFFLDVLEENCLEENTIVLFMSEHGWNLGEHDCWQKLRLWEDSIRTPLIISISGMKSAGKQCDRIVEHTDIYPTLAELCGGTPPRMLPGQSMNPLLDDPASKAWADKPACTVTYSGAAESLRTPGWHLNFWAGGKKGIELYEVTTTPANLPRSPKIPNMPNAEATELHPSATRMKFGGKIPAGRSPKKKPPRKKTVKQA